MTKQERMKYLILAGWNPMVDYELPDFRLVVGGWHRDQVVCNSFLGAFMLQQAADARAERAAEGR